MLNKLRERMGREEGFTLIELLVVMLILGILAAIAIPSFFSQRDKARDADAKAAVRTAQTAVETYATERDDGAYTGVAVADLTRIEETLAPLGTDLTVTSTADSYSVQVDSETPNSFRISRNSAGAVTLTCGTTVVVTAPFGDTGGNGGCPADETW